MAETYHRLTPRPAPALLSIVIPVYNEESAIPHLRRRMTAFFTTLDAGVELLLVNDGSSDRSLDLLLDWAAEDHRAKVVSLARNFGHQAAVTAGLDYCLGDAVVIMDADLQDPPEVIPEMIARYGEGYDVVYGRRVSRLGETWFKRATAWLFYRLMRVLTDSALPADAGDFRLVSRPCLNALLALRETHRFLRGMVAWVGFPQVSVPYVRQARAAGTTKYPLSKMLLLAWNAAVSFSPVPLRLSFALGLVLFLVGITQGVNAVVRTLLGLYTVPGWTSLMVVLCLIGGSILISIGVLGEYIGKIFEEVKQRPLYVVAKVTNLRGPGAPPVSIHRDELDRLAREVR